MKQLLKDIAIIGAGQGAPQGDNNYCDNGTPFVKAGNLQELLDGKDIYDIQQVSDEVAKKHKLKLYPKGTILFAKSGMSCMKGYVYVLPQDAFVVSHLACITPNEDVSEYLRYYFTFHKPNHLVKDAAYPSISLSDIGELEIDMKTDLERIEVVNQLHLIESIISLRQQELIALDDLIKARFVELFGDAVHNDNGWNTSSVEDVCLDIYGGGTPSKSHLEYYEDGDIPWVSSKDIKSDVLYGSQIYINQLGVDNSSAKMVPVNSVIMVIRSGILKHTLPVAINAVPITVNQDLKVFIPSERILTRFLAVQFKMLEKDILSGVRAVTADNIEFNTLKERHIIVPPIKLQQQFVEFCKQVDKSKVV